MPDEKIIRSPCIKDTIEDSGAASINGKSLWIYVYLP
jgi:hypothetical protein